MFNRLMGKKEDPFARGCIELMLALACADGQLEEDELDSIFVAIANHPKMNGLSWREIKSIAMRSLSAMDKQGEAARVQAVAQMLPTTDMRLEALDMCLSVALADGDLESEEVIVLELIQRIFGLTDDQINDLLNGHGGQ